MKDVNKLIENALKEDINKDLLKKLEESFDQAFTRFARLEVTYSEGNPLIRVARQPCPHCQEIVDFTSVLEDGRQYTWQCPSCNKPAMQVMARLITPDILKEQNGNTES